MNIHKHIYTYVYAARYSCCMHLEHRIFESWASISRELGNLLRMACEAARTGDARKVVWVWLACECTLSHNPALLRTICVRTHHKLFARQLSHISSLGSLGVSIFWRVCDGV